MNFLREQSVFIINAFPGSTKYYYWHNFYWWSGNSSDWAIGQIFISAVIIPVIGLSIWSWAVTILVKGCPHGGELVRLTRLTCFVEIPYCLYELLKKLNVFIWEASHSVFPRSYLKDAWEWRKAMLLIRTK